MAQPEFGDTQEFGASTWQARVPRHFVYPLTGGVPPSTMIERRERAVFGWRFVFSGYGMKSGVTGFLEAVSSEGNSR